LSHPLRQRRRGDAGGAGGRHALPCPLPLGAPALPLHLSLEYSGRDRPPAYAKAGGQTVSDASLNVQSRRRSFWRSGEPYVWVTGAAVALSLLLLIGLVAVVGSVGLGHFWPAGVARLVDDEGRVVMGE